MLELSIHFTLILCNSFIKNACYNSKEQCPLVYAWIYLFQPNTPRYNDVIQLKYDFIDRVFWNDRILKEAPLLQYSKPRTCISRHLVYKIECILVGGTAYGNIIIIRIPEACVIVLKIKVQMGSFLSCNKKKTCKLREREREVRLCEHVRMHEYK